MEDKVVKDPDLKVKRELESFSVEELRDMMVASRRSGRLTMSEGLNLDFSLRVSKKLEAFVPDKSRLPVIYIGAGGDGISALFVSGSTEIVLADPTPFLTKKRDGEEIIQHGSVDEAWTASENMQEQHSVGHLTYWENVRPAQELFASLKKLGFLREQISISLDQGGIATISVNQLNGKNITFIYYPHKIENSNDLKNALAVLRKTSEDNYGVFAKGGGGLAVRNLVNSLNESQKPKYVACDTLTNNIEGEVANLEGYNVDNISARYDFATSWGWVKDPTTLESDAVIGIRR